MKFALACTVLLAVVMVATEAKLDEDLPGPSVSESPYVASVPERANRQRRVTCDILGFNTMWGSFGHAACAAHCWALMKGFNGGYCDGKGICICRK